MSMKAGEQVGTRWSTDEINIFQTGLSTHGSNYKLILNDLIEEDFTSRTYDNVRALHLIVQ